MKEALEALEEPYASAAQAGLRGLKQKHRGLLSPRDPRRLTGSIDLDAALASHPEHGSSPRWDYGVGLIAPTGRQRCAVWLEVHGAANNRAAREVCEKVRWLRSWIDQHGRELRLMTQTAEHVLDRSPYIWVSVGPVDLPRAGQGRRLIAQEGLDMPVRRVPLP